MTELSVTKIVEVSKLIDNYDYLDDADENNYVSMELYHHPDGRHFRYIISSGFNSNWNGEVGSIEWLTDTQAINWKEHT